MKKTLHLTIFILICLLCSCNHEKKQEEGIAKDTYINSLDTLYSPKYSNGFSINLVEDSPNVVISVFNPWQGAENVSSQLVIARDGFNHEGSKIPIIQTEAKRIVCMSSTFTAMLDALDASERIVGVSGKEYISNPEIRNNPEIIDIGYEGFIDYEKLLALKPDLVLLFSINGASSMEPKLNELGIPFVYIGDYVEEDPLGKSEWIVAIAEIIGKRELGIEKFNEIATKYNGLKEKVANSNLPHKPTVMVNAPFMDSWFMPSSKSYVARMIEDAGGDYIYRKNTGSSSLPVDLEESLKLVSEADFWINIGTVKSLEELKKTFPKFVNADCVKNNALYNNNARVLPAGGNDAYESGVVNPDLILKDLIKIFHPSLMADEDFYYYHKLI